MGERTEKGFTLAGPGLQVFEKKATVDTAATVTGTIPAEPTIPPPPTPAALVTATTKAGTTVTVAKRQPLRLKR